VKHTALLATLGALAANEVIDWGIPVREALLKAGMKDIPTAEEWKHIPWWGPIDDVVRDSLVHDICLNGPGRDIVIDRSGMRSILPLALHRDWIIWLQNKLLVNRMGPKEDPTTWSDLSHEKRLGVARGGIGLRRLRYTATREGLTPDGPSLTLRILPDEFASLEDLVAAHVLPKDVAEILRRAILTKHVNIIVSGGTGSGKTTLAAALKREMGEMRCVVVQDIPELPTGDPFNDIGFVLEDGDEFAFLEAVRLALRLNIERVILGEGRGAELWAMIQAASTGHPILTTLHATNGIEVFLRMESYAAAARHTTPAIVRANLSALDVIVVHMDSDATKQRRVTQVVELRRGSSSTPGEPYECAIVREFRNGRLTMIEPIRSEWAKER